MHCLSYKSKVVVVLHDVLAVLVVWGATSDMTCPEVAALIQRPVANRVTSGWLLLQCSTFCFKLGILCSHAVRLGPKRLCNRFCYLQLGQSSPQSFEEPFEPCLTHHNTCLLH